MTIICEGGDRCGKSTVCDFLKDKNYIYHHFDYPKSDDVVSIYNDYFKNQKVQNELDPVNHVYDRAMYSEYAYSRYYGRKSNMTLDQIHRLEQIFQRFDSIIKPNVCILYLENSPLENLKLLEDEGEGKITSLDEIFRLRSYYYEVLKRSHLPVFTYNYQCQNIQTVYNSIKKYFGQDFLID